MQYRQISSDDEKWTLEKKSPWKEILVFIRDHLFGFMFTAGVIFLFILIVRAFLLGF